MKRTLSALLLASATLLAGACGGDAPTSGDSNPDNQQTQVPGPAPTE
jgi:ABC-type glycerol-3-phosphate transport system substrate-binding protein